MPVGYVPLGNLNFPVELIFAVPKAVEVAHKYGLMFLTWSPKESSEIKRLFTTYRVDGVIADDISNALQVCRDGCYSASH